jgi:hypothetical protein
LKSFYTYVGRVICIEALDEQSFTWAVGFIESLRFELLDGQEIQAADYTLRLRRGGAKNPIRQPNVQPFPIMRGQCWMDGSGNGFFDVDDSSIVIDENERGVVEVRFGETPYSQQPDAIISVLTYAVLAMLRRNGLFDLHAAAIVSPESARGALIVGDSGRGKSSLTVRLVENGWRYLSDDMVVLSNGASGVQAHGLRRRFMLTKVTLAACELPRVNESHGSFWINNPDKQHIEPEVVFPDRFVSSCVPGALFFPTITGEATSSVKKLPQSEAMTLLVKRCPWSGFDSAVAPEYLQMLARLAGQSRAYELRSGRDLLEKHDSAASLFAAYV